MADVNTCEECRVEFPTGRGLKIHNSRIHGEGGTSGNIDTTGSKEKLESIIFKAKPSAMINIPLLGMARRYHDPTICLSPQESSDMDGVIQDIMAEMGTDAKTLARLTPILPWLAAIFIGFPILLDKWDKIQVAREGLTASPSSQIIPKPADGTAPTLNRKDVMPDA
jgi:hypothetical protein